MKKIFCLTTLAFVFAGGVSAQSNITNMSDSLDKNIIPAEQEARKKVEKPTNLPDRVDRNKVPAPFEERQEEEESVFSDSKSQKNQKQ